MNNFLTEINAGGSHSNNPLGGVPIGNGNTAEQGETMTKDYVFSNRLFLDEATIAQFHLPKRLKGRSIADASKILTRLSKESNAAADMNTSKDMLERLKGANEALKPVEETPPMPEGMGMPQPQGNMAPPMEGQEGAQFFFGGDKEGEKPGAGAYLGAAEGALGLATQAFGKTGIEMNGSQSYEKSNVLGGAASGAIAGANAGKGFGMPGMIIGGLAGGIGGIFGANKANKEKEIANNNYTLSQNSKMRQTDFALGGPLPYGKKDDVAMPQVNQLTNPLDGLFSGLSNTATNFGGLPFGRNDAVKAPEMPDNPERGSFVKGVLEGLGGKEGIGDKLNTAARYAPVLSNYLQYKNMDKPRFEALDRIDSKYRSNQVDEAGLVNQAREAEGSNRRALRESSGGNMGALRSNLLMSHLNSVKGRSGAFMQANNANNQDDRFGQQFNQRNAQINLRQSNQENDINARNIAAYDTNRSRMLSSVTEGIGNIGLENQRKKYPEKMGLFYDFLGKYMEGNNKKTT